MDHKEVSPSDGKREARLRLESQLIAGLESGEGRPLTKSDWAAIRADVSKRLKRSRRA